MIVRTAVAAAFLLRLLCFETCESSSVDLLQFLGGENMLTGHTNAHWRAVRKAVAPAFSAGNMRSDFRHLLSHLLCPKSSARAASYVSMQAATPRSHMRMSARR